MKHLIAVACAVTVASGAAAAEETLKIGPPPAWVQPVAPPPGSADAGGSPLRLLDVQSRVDDAGLHQFGHQIIRLGSPAALQAAGNVAVTWQPSVGGATVHQVRIHRAGRTIDVLDAGKLFSTFRREAGLEAARLDGQLTSVMQVPDLRVGDELEFSFTVDQRNPVLAGHIEAEALMLGGLRTDRLHLAASWPTARAVRWKTGSGLPKAAVRRTGTDTILTLDADNAALPVMPTGAPARYMDVGRFQLSDFADWADVARLMAPLYAKAAVIAPGSALDAQARRVAALSPDPKARAAAALRLVQGEVRYFAKLDGLGGYLPAPAEEVWAARSGDCKGKTALLLALLRALDVPAVPALVSATRGDGVDASLPMPGRFDHVVVRATIAGKDYWLDGTRLGDRTLDELAVPAFTWALPVVPADAAPVRLAATAPTRPEVEWRLDLDARAGLRATAKAVGTGIFRGDTAVATAANYSLADATQRDEALRKLWSERHDWVTIDKVSYALDEATGEVRIGFTGTGTMDWNLDGDTPSFRYEANKARIGYDLTPKRTPGMPADAPVVVNPGYVVTHQTIRLPDDGRGFYLEGGAIDETAGGVRYQRTVSLKDGRFDMSASTRSAAGEISLADAKAADKVSDAIFARQLFVHLPGSYRMAGGTLATPDAGTAPELAASLQLASRGKPAEAIETLDRLVARDAKSVRARVVRGHLQLQAGKADAADRDADAALALDGHDPAALALKAELLLHRNRGEDALIALDRLVLLYPDAAAGYLQRGDVRERLGRSEDAMADYGIAIDKQPDNAAARIGRIRLLSAANRTSDALADARAFVDLVPSSAVAQALHGNVLAVAGRKDEAAAALARSLAIEPTADAYVTRLRFDLSGNDDAKLADMLAVLRLDPTRGLPDDALRAVMADPTRAAKLRAFYAVASLKASTGARERIDYASARADAIGGRPQALLALLDKAVASRPDDLDARNEACWARATRKLELDHALADCDAALKVKGAPAIYDSRGLVKLQRGDAVGALADYEAALAKGEPFASGLYGRGLAKRRAGQQAAGDADLAAARKLYPEIDRTYAGYGLVP